MTYRSSLLLTVCILFAGESTLTASDVETVALPDSTFRHQVVVDRSGTVHMVYAHLRHRGDLFYANKENGQDEFSAPLQVNSTPHCVAGFNMAVGENGRVHVLVRPNAQYSRRMLKRTPKFYDLKYMLYCRLNDQGTEFEEERDLSGKTFGFEGAGAIVADGEGSVYIFWHGLVEPGPEQTRAIFVARSTDEGRTFTEPKRIRNEVVGACACCSMSGTVDIDGRIHLVYRNSESTGSKDSYLLVSADKGKTFEATLLEPWAMAGCPGSVYSLACGSAGVFVAWDTQGQIRFAKSDSTVTPTTAPADGKRTRSPVVVCNSKGEVLFAWSEADEPRRFIRGGDLAWLIYDGNGDPVSEKEVLLGGIGPRWSTPVAYAKPDGGFVILYCETGAIPE